MATASSSPTRSRGTSYAAIAEKIEALRPIIEQYSAETEANRHLARPVVDALREAGLFRMVLPREMGGLGMDPAFVCRAIEELARIDSAAGWNVGISQAWGAGALRLMPEEGLLEVGPDVMLAGAFNPPGALSRRDGGYQFTGRGPFASGCTHATHVVFSAIEMAGGEPVINPATGAPDVRLVLIPSVEVTIHDTWHTIGMRGTGSHDVEAADVFVPEHRVGTFGQVPTQVYSRPEYMAFHNGIHYEAATSIGVAQAAIDYVIALAGKKTPSGSTSTLALRTTAQAQVARAQALVNASRSTLLSSANECLEEATRTGAVSMPMKLTMQLAANFTAEACAEAVNLLWTAAGATGIRESSPLGRHFRDIHTLSQHASKSVPRYESTGQVMLGLESDWPIFAL